MDGRAVIGLGAGTGEPGFQVTFKLEPRELFMVDNRRVLYGRTGFSGVRATATSRAAMPIVTGCGAGWRYCGPSLGGEDSR